MTGPDELITGLARRQHSIFLGAQVTAQGVTRKMLRGRVASGRR